MQLTFANLQQTIDFAENFASSIVLPNARALVIWLQGDLGVGKTSLVRAILPTLSYHGRVKSPTYSLIETYPIVLYPDSRLYLHHFDFYRFNSPDEYCQAGLEEYFIATNIAFIEWPDKALPYTPEPDVTISLQYSDNMASDSRQASIYSGSEIGEICLKQLRIKLQQTNLPSLQKAEENI